MAIRKDSGIAHLTIMEEVTTMIPGVHSILTCRKCGFKKEFAGSIDMTSLPGTWGNLSLNTAKYNSVIEYLICPNCIKEMREIMGLPPNEANPLLKPKGPENEVSPCYP